ncbi:unnamed protein product [Moneuplotes crassus]|uniref:Uncharacterized protein n=1 Tax=Euplotes crassus TaxID=5936 RepID=A0AAD1XDY3_EUPCR|nr:unnamed protein product [Moneuplotes crassus]
MMLLFPDTSRGLKVLRICSNSCFCLILAMKKRLQEFRKFKRKTRTKKKIIIKKMILNPDFRMEAEEIKVIHKKKIRKAPLCVSHGSPKKILKRCSNFVEKGKDELFLNLSLTDYLPQKLIIKKSPDSLFSPRVVVGDTSNAVYNSPGNKQRSFLQVIYNRVTKKKFLEKQKLKFLLSKSRNKSHPDSEDFDLNAHRIELLEEILRNIREKSVYKIHTKQIKECFRDDTEILAYAKKLREYQLKFLSHLLKRKKAQDEEMIHLENNLLKKIVNTRLVKRKGLFCQREDYYRLKMSRSAKFSSTPMRSGSKLSNGQGTTNFSFHDPRSIERRFCPPISSHELSLGQRNRLMFSDRINMNSVVSLR